MAPASKEEEYTTAGIDPSSGRHDEAHQHNVFDTTAYGTAYELPSIATRRDSAEFILCIYDDAGTASNAWYISKTSAEPKGRPV